MKLREYFLMCKENKNNDLFNNFFSSARSGEYHDASNSPERTSKTGTEMKRLLNKVVILVFFGQKVFA